MRSHPSCWNKTLTRLGFRRKFKKQRYDYLKRRSLFETLESRQMLSVTQVSEEELFTQAVAAPTMASVSGNSSLTVDTNADFDVNLRVDNGDLAIWQREYGATNAFHNQGDADFDEDVDGSDFLAWQHNFQPQATTVVDADTDFNGDFNTDGADLGNWQQGYGTTNATHDQGDADTDGNVNGADFLAWQRDYGKVQYEAFGLTLPAALLAPAETHDPDGDEFIVNDQAGYSNGYQYAPAAASLAGGATIVVWSGEGNGDTSGVWGQLLDAQGNKQGSVFQIDDPGAATTGFNPTVASDGDDRFVVLWHDLNDTTGQAQIFAQRYDFTTGVATSVGSRIHVNDTTPAGLDYYPSVSMRGDESFVISWRGWNGSSDNFDVFARRYQANGVSLGSNGALGGPPFVIASFSNQIEYTDRHSIVADDTGFWITWRELSAGATGSSLKVLRATIQPNNSILSTALETLKSTSRTIYDASIGKNAQGDLLVVWSETAFNSTDSDIRARRYTGGSWQSEFLIATSETGILSNVVGDNAGRFAIASYQIPTPGDPSPSTNTGAFIQWYDPSNGGMTPRDDLTAPLLLNSTNIGEDFFTSPALAVGEADQVLVAWTAQESSNTESDIYAQRFRPVFTGPLEVSTTEDEFDGNFTPGDLSLREAMYLASQRSGPDTITFDSTFHTGPAETITLSHGTAGDRTLVIDSDITIIGPGVENLTIDGNGEDNIFYHSSEFTPVSNFSLSGMKLTGANSYAVAALSGVGTALEITLDQIEISENDGGAVQYSSLGVATLNIMNSTIANNGQSGTFSGPAIALGEALADIKNSTISGNQSTGLVAGIFALFTNIAVTNTTITDNHADINNLHSGSPRAGGLRSAFYSNTVLENSIVAGNFAHTQASDVNQESNATFTGTYNLIGDAGNTGFVHNDPENNQVLGSAATLGLGSLANNGGPTRTHALLAGSPAIDKGSSSLAFAANLIFDQRGIGFTRFRGNGVDVGAFETDQLANQSPVLDLDADNSAAAGLDFSTTFTEGGGAIAIVDSDATLTDDDGTNLESLTVTLTNPQDGGVEFLTASNLQGLSVTGSGTHQVTLSGSAGLSVYLSVLKTGLTYNNTSQDPSTTTSRTIDFVANDGSNLSEVATTTVDVLAINNAPVVSAPGAPLSATEKVSLAVQGSGFSVTDVEGANFGATATISVGEGTITVAGGDSGVSVTSGNSTSTVTLNGTITELNNLLSGVGTGTITYFNGSDTPSNSTLLTVTVNDLGNSGIDPGLSGTEFTEEASGSVIINITPENNAPRLDLDGSASGLDFATTFVEDSPAIAIADIDATLTDVDSTELASLTVRLTNPQNDADESLSVVNPQGLMLSGDGTHQIVLSGPASIVTYLNVLQNELTYNNTSQNPGTTTRVIEFVASDGISSSLPAFANVTVTPNNDTPNAVDDDATVNENQSVVINVLGNDSDPEGDSLTITGFTHGANGTVENNGDGTLTFTPDPFFDGTTSFTYTIDDGNDEQDTATVNVTVNDLFDPSSNAVINGLKYHDLNANGVRDTDLIVGDQPDVVFVIDVSWSTVLINDDTDDKPRFFLGDVEFGDFNEDHLEDIVNTDNLVVTNGFNTILDGELGGFSALNQRLIDLGFGDTAEVSIVIFAGDSQNQADAARLDMNPLLPGIQDTTTPNAMVNGELVVDLLLKNVVANGFRGLNVTGDDVDEVAAINFQGGTNYEDALQEVTAVLDTLHLGENDYTNDNVIFLSDGLPNQSNTGNDPFVDFLDEVNILAGRGTNLRAFGVGENSDPLPLGDIDYGNEVDGRATPANAMGDFENDEPAIQFLRTEELYSVFAGLQSDLVVFTEPTLPDFEFYLDLNTNGVRDADEPTVTANENPGTFTLTSETSTLVADTTGGFSFPGLVPGTYQLREVPRPGWTQTGPNSPDFYTIEVNTDGIVVEPGDFNLGYEFGNIESPFITLTEGTRLVTNDDDPTANGVSTTFDVQATPGPIRIDFANAFFDTQSNPGDVNDAFEFSLLDANGRSVVPTIGNASDAFFNWTQGQSQLLANGVALVDFDETTGSGGIIVDLTNILSNNANLGIGDPLTIVARLINNDADNTTSVDIAFNISDSTPQSAVFPSGTSVALLPAARNDSDRIYSGIAYSQLHDVTRAFDIGYQHTTTEQNDDGVERLVTRVKLTKKPGGLQVRGDLLLAVDGITDQETGGFEEAQLTKLDGRLPVGTADLPAGTPFVYLSNFIDTTDGFYNGGASVEHVELVFEHPDSFSDNQRFNFDLVVLGELNDPPRIVSEPYADTRGNAYPIDFLASANAEPRQVLEVVNGNTFKYRPDTIDPNNDRVRIELVASPDPSLQPIDSDGNGYEDTIEWTPDVDGVYQFVLRAVDEWGAFDPAFDQVIDVRVTSTAQNRPPKFDTEPITEAAVGETYEYDSNAFDPDGDDLTYTGRLGARPQRYEIPIGEFLLGEMNYLTFINDDDVGNNSDLSTLGISRFSNIRLYESDWPSEPQVLKFNQSRFQSYRTADGQDGQNGLLSNVEVLGDGSVVVLQGNAWKAYELDSPYNVTPNTVLAFTLASEVQGELHGIGLDSQTVAIKDDHWFELHGTQDLPSAQQGFNNLYDPAWSEIPVFDVHPDTGVVTWMPPVEAQGQWVHVELKATDPGGLFDNQSYEIFVEADPENRPPEIVSTPEDKHYLPITPTPSLDMVEPDQLAFTLAEGQEITLPVAIDVSDGGGLSADIVFVVDESGSMSDEWDFLDAQLRSPPSGMMLDSILPVINSKLTGSGITDNRFAVVGAGGFIASDFADAATAAINANALGDSYYNPYYAGTEDGYHGINSVITSLSFRPDSARAVILVTDEGRDIFDLSLTFSSIENDLEDLGASLHSLVNVRYEDGLELDALGINANGDAFIADGLGGYSTSTGGVATTWSGSTNDTNPIEAYVNLALQVDSDPGPAEFFGTAWDLDQLRSGGPTAESFATAFTDILAAQIVEQSEIGLEINGSDLGFSFELDPSFDDGSHFLVTFVGDGLAHNFDIEFVTVNGGAVLGAIPTAINAGYQYDLRAFDLDGDEPLVFDWTAGVAQNGASLAGDIITWNPDTPGNYDFSVTVSDGRGGFDVQEWTVEVIQDSNGVNNDPTIQDIPPADAQEWREWEYQVVAEDIDDDRLRYYLIENISDSSSAPVGMQIDRNTGLVSWTPSLDQSGPQKFTVLVADGRGGGARREFNLVVEPRDPANVRPKFDTLPIRTVLAGEVYRYEFDASDIDGDALTYANPFGPDDLVFDEEGQAIIWQTDDVDIGRHRIVLSVRDGGAAVFQDFILEVLPSNIAPEITSNPFGPARTGFGWTYDVIATDDNNDDLFYEIEAPSAEMAGNPPITISPTGQIAWTPTVAGNFPVFITVSDGRGGVATQDFVLPVRTDNAGPTLDYGSSVPIFVSEPWKVEILAADPDGTIDNYSLDSYSSSFGLEVIQDTAANDLGILDTDNNNWYLFWANPLANADNVLATVTVEDNLGATASRGVSLPVNVRPPENEPPTFVDNPFGAALVGRQWSYTFEAVDMDLDDIVTLTILNDPANPAPAWLDQPVLTPFPGNPNEGAQLVLSGTPAAQDAGTTALIQVEATDILGEGFTVDLWVPVLANTQPYIVNAVESAPAELAISDSYEFDVIDFDAEQLRFDLVSPAPGTGSFDVNTAAFGDPPVWVPSSSLDPSSVDFNAPSKFRLNFKPEAEGQQSVTVRVTDGGGNSVEHTILLDVVNPNNRPPDVTLQFPNTLFVGQTLDVLLESDDPDGDPLTFAFLDELGNRITEISNRSDGNGAIPTGMTINSQSGRIEWTPTAEQVGSGYSFTVQVTDGRHLVSLGPVTFEVIEEPTAGGNTQPYIVIGPASASVPINTQIDFDFGFIDFDTTDTLTLMNVSGPGSFLSSSISSPSDDPENPSLATYRLTTPATPALEPLEFTISVTDGQNPPVLHTVFLEVFDPESTANSLPGGSLRARRVTAKDQQFVAQAQADDPDGDTPYYGLLNDNTNTVVTNIDFSTNLDGSPAPIGLSINPLTGRITWTPTDGEVTPDGGAPYGYTIVFGDQLDFANGFTQIGPVDLTVVNRLTNAAPEITSSPEDFVLQDDGSLTYQAVATDEDDDPVTWTLVEGPANASIDPITGLLRWLPSAEDVGKSITAVIQATDPYNLFDQQGLTLRATRTTTVNHAPEIKSTPPQPAGAGQEYLYLVRAEDVDGDRIRFESDNPLFTIADNGDATAVLRWANPTEGTEVVTVSAIDEQGLTGKQTITLTIGPAGGTGSVVDTPPEILSRPPLAVAVDQLYYHQIIASDPDVADTGSITYDFTLTPSGGGSAIVFEAGEFDSSTGLINWQPTMGEEDSYDATVSATQNNVTITLSYTLQVTVPGINTPPQLQEAPGLQAAPGQEFTLDVPGFDPDPADVLEYFLVDSDHNLVRELDGMTITPDGRVTWPVPASIDLSSNPTRTFRVHVQDQERRPADQDLLTGPESYTRDYTVSIVADQAPTINLNTSTLRPQIGEEVGFAVLATDDLGTPDVRLVISETWPGGRSSVPVSIAPNGVARYTVPNNAPTDGSGVIEVTAFANDGVNPEVSTATIELTARATDNSAPVVQIASPGFDGFVVEIDEATPLEISVIDDSLVYYRVAAIPVGGGEPIVLQESGVRDGQTIIASVGDPSPEQVGVISPFELADGTYELQLFAQDADGRGSSVGFPISITSEVKLGNFSFTVTDMTIPVAGFPISIERTYNTLDVNTRGEFGNGWSLNLVNGQLEADVSANRENKFWARFGYEPALFYGGQININLPGGEVQTFTTVPVPLNPESVQGGRFGSLLGFANLFAIAFQPATGQGTRLDLVGGQRHFYPGEFLDYLPTQLFNESFGSMPLVVDPNTGEFRALSAAATSDLGIPFNPATPGDMPRLDYRLTQADGSQFIFNSETGEMISATDADGNRLVFNGDDLAVYDRLGDEIGRLDIQRENGLVTRVENEIGYGVDYHYDSNDDLERVVEEIFRDPSAGGALTESREWRYIYDTDTTVFPSEPAGRDRVPHYLRQIIDPKGNVVSAVDFHPDGKLKSSDTTDGFSQDVDYSTNPDGSGTQTVTDAFGVQSTYNYGNDGNIDTLSVTGSAGGSLGTWTFDHDDQGRLVYQEDALGRVSTWDFNDDAQTITIVGAHDPSRAGEPDYLDDFTTMVTLNSQGAIESIVGLDGRAEYRKYGIFGLEQITDETGFVYSRSGYDDLGRLNFETSEGNTFLYDYIDQNHTKITTPTEEIDAFYDRIGQLTSFEDDGGMNTFTLDGLGRTREVVYNDGDLTVNYNYGVNGVESDWTQVDSASTGTIGRQFTDSGQLAGWTREVNGVTQTTAAYRYVNGRLDEEEDQFGNISKYHYDEFGRTQRIEDISTGSEVVYTYDIVGRALTETRNYIDFTGPRSETTTYTYSLDDRGPATVQDPLGFITEFNVEGNVSSVRSPLEDLGSGALGEIAGITRETQIIRNAAGLPITYINPDNSQTTVAYLNSDTLNDAEQLPTLVRDESGRERRFTYFDDGRLRSSTDLGGVATTFSYDDNLPDGGSSQTVDLPGPGAVTYIYNQEGRLVRVERPGFGDFEVLDLDGIDGLDFTADGQPQSIRLPSGETVTITYDSIGRLKTRQVTTPGVGVTEHVEYHYDPQSDNLLRTENLLSSSDESVYIYYPAGHTHAGKLQKIVAPTGESIEYQYDALGRVGSLVTKPQDTGVTAHTTTYEYDARGNVTEVNDPFSGITTYTYDQLGRLETRTLPNGVVTSWTFDNRDRLTSIVHRDGASGPVIQSFTYDHPVNAVGEPHRITREDGSYIDLVYDDSLRLQSEAYYSSTTTGNNLIRTINYDYDDQGNRTSRTVDGNVDSYAIDGTSGYELNGISGANPATFGYDDGGRLTSIDRASLDATLNYNAAGQITSVDNATGNDQQYAYDAFGRRISATDGANTTNFLIAPAAQRLGAGVLDVEVQHLATDSSGNVLQGWIYAGENPILRYGTTGAGSVEYYLEDASDSVRALIDANKNVVADYEYDAFGLLLPGSDTPTSAAGGDFGFHAAWLDDATGLYHIRARTYDPETGRFLSVDPADGVAQAPESYNIYAFANNNPHLFSDPTGLFSLIEINVNISVNDTLGAARNVAISEARQFLLDEIGQLATKQLFSVFKGFIPGGQFLDRLGSLTGADQGTEFDKLLKGELFKFFSPFKTLPFANQIWIDPHVNKNTGIASFSGINLVTGPEGTPTSIRDTRPDFIIRDGSPTNKNLNSLLIGDIKRSIVNVYNDVWKKDNQYLAIKNHALNQEAIPVAAYIALTRGTSSRRIEENYTRIIAKEAAFDGVLLVTARLLNKR